MTFYGVIVIGSNASELEKEEFTCVHGTQTHKLPSLKERFWIRKPNWQINDEKRWIQFCMSTNA